MSEGKLIQLDIAAVFHSILFAYQRIIIDFLGEVSSRVLTARTMPLIEKIIEKASPGLVNAEDMDAPLKNLQICWLFLDLLVKLK